MVYAILNGTLQNLFYDDGVTNVCGTGRLLFVHYNTTNAKS